MRKRRQHWQQREREVVAEAVVTGTAAAAAYATVTAVDGESGAAAVRLELDHLASAFAAARKLVSRGRGVYGYGGSSRKQRREEAAAAAALDTQLQADRRRELSRKHRYSDVSDDPNLLAVHNAENAPAARAAAPFASSRDAKLRLRWDVLDVDGVNRLFRDDAPKLRLRWDVLDVDGVNRLFRDELCILLEDLLR